MRTAPLRILVTDGDSRAALAVTRSLGRLGHHVVVAERRTPALAQTSRYCSARLTYPDPATQGDACVSALLDAVRTHAIDVLIPVADVVTMLVTDHRAAFEDCCRVPVPDAATVRRAADKADVIRTAMRLGIPVPRTAFVEQAEAATADAADIGYPLVVKPRRSRLKTEGGWLSCSVSYAASPEELQRQAATWPEAGLPMLLQEKIEGPGLGVFMCYKDGTLVAEFSHRRLREKPPSGGVSVLSESIAVPADARRYAEALLTELRWHGVAMVEFKVDQRDRVPRLMEINGRFWGSLQLAIDAGVDFPAILLATLDQGPPSAPPAYRIGVRNRWLWGDFDALLLQLFSPRSNGSPSKVRSVREFLRLWGRDLYYESPRLSDLRPWVFETGEWMRQAFSGLGSRR